MSATTREANGNAAQYLAFARLFSYPSDAVWTPLEREGMAPARAQADREAEYMDVFELGHKGKAVPLYEGLCLPAIGREGILEDLLRFYEHFDVKLATEDRDFPDHLVAELEFLSHLCAMEHAAAERREDVTDLRRAQHDFLQRHLLAWVPSFAERLGTGDTIYGEIARGLAELCSAHAARLRDFDKGELQ